MSSIPGVLRILNLRGNGLSDACVPELSGWLRSGKLLARPVFGMRYDVADHIDGDWNSDSAGSEWPALLLEQNPKLSSDAAAGLAEAAAAVRSSVGIPYMH